jgi:hypothetical protein
MIKGLLRKGPLVAVGLFALVLLICYLVATQSKSVLVSTTQSVADFFEGFQQQQTSTTKCPGIVLDAYGNVVSPAYTFFTNATGESMCCAGTVDKLKHTCKPAANAANSLGAGMCAFRPGVPHPTLPGQTLPLCGAVADGVNAANGTNICPPSLPKYAASQTQKSCCKTGTNLDGTECIQRDLEQRNFCRVTPTQGEPNCAAMKSLETAVCPPNLQKSSYTMGAKEIAAYSAAKGKTAPLCFGVEGSCFPDGTVADLKSQGIFTREPGDPTKWKYACSGYKSFQDGIQGVQTQYLTPPPA